MGIQYDWLMQQLCGRQIVLCALLDDPPITAGSWLTDVVYDGLRVVVYELGTTGYYLWGGSLPLGTEPHFPYGYTLAAP